MKRRSAKLAIMLAMAITMSSVAGCGSSDSGSSDAAAEESAEETSDEASASDDAEESGSTSSDLSVEKIELGSSPTKTAYVSGEEFSLEGGTIIITYEDGSTEEVSMEDERFEIKEPGMTASGTKTVTVKLGTKSTRFTVEVAEASYSVTYHMNYDGAEDQVESVIKGQNAEELAPERDGYTLIGWYINADYTQAYDFDEEITESIDLYALWSNDNADNVTVTFDYDYYGAALTSYSYPVESGTAVSQPSADPERTGYSFAGWVDESGAEYDFTQVITEDTTITAVWEKAVDGVQEYIFEAEDTDLSGKTGPAISGTANETGMIVLSEDRNASNDRSVGYLYQNGISLEFYIASDEEVSDATIYISLSAEMEDLEIDPSTYGIYLNGEKLAYGTISITDVPEYDSTTYSADCADFEYYLLGENLTLKEGANVIQLITENSDGYTGTTMVAHAPLVDAIKIETTAVVTWDENYGVPATDNYQ